MKKYFVFNMFALGLLLSPKVIAKCYIQPETFFKNSSATSLYACQSKKKKSFQIYYCHKKTKSLNCKRINIKANLLRLKHVVDASPQKKKALATYLTLMNWQESSPINNSSSFTIQTGKYASLSLNYNNSLNSACFNEIMQGAVAVSKAFKKFNFSFSENISSCRNLSKGVASMLKNSDAVRANLDRFHSPLHSIYFGDTTKFNHYLVGQMGLHINVNKPKEIRRRIINNETSQGQIQHEKYGRTKVGRKKLNL